MIRDSTNAYEQVAKCMKWKLLFTQKACANVHRECGAICWQIYNEKSIRRAKCWQYWFCRIPRSRTLATATLFKHAKHLHKYIESIRRQRGAQQQHATVWMVCTFWVIYAKSNSCQSGWRVLANGACSWRMYAKVSSDGSGCSIEPSQKLVKSMFAILNR